MVRIFFKVLMVLVILVFSTCIYQYKSLQTYLYDGFYQVDDGGSGVITRASALKQQYKFKTDDLLKSVHGFKKTDILLYSAVAGNMTESSIWDEVSIFGWESKHLKGQVYMCCLLYPSGRIELSHVYRKKYGHPLPCPIEAKHFACEMKQEHRKELAIAVTLTAKENTVCDAPLASYINIDYPYTHPEEIAIFAKVLYENLSSRDLITWIEVHRLLGFNKVLVYPYQLNSNATRVLQYYERIGWLKILPFDIPRPDIGMYLPPMGTKNRQGWNYNYVSLMDGFERLKGYKYIVSFDVDEYIIPRKNESWMDLFDRVFRQNNDAAGFYFGTYLHVKSWDPTNKTSPFTIGRYLNRTKLTSDRQKHVSIPSRIMEGGFNTHRVRPRKIYKTSMITQDGMESLRISYIISKKDAALHHFRSCRPEWIDEDSKFPCYRISRYRDETVNNLLKKVEKDVLSLVSILDV